MWSCYRRTGFQIRSSTQWGALRKKPSEKRRSRRKTVPEGAGYDDSGDYRGKFTAELFNKWFDKLCITLQNVYGSTYILMDQWSKI